MAVTQALRFLRQRSQAVLPKIPFPAYVNHRAVTVAETETVPANAYVVVIKTDAVAWFSRGTAAVPAGDVTDGTGSFPISPGEAILFDVKPGTEIRVIAASGTANVSFWYYDREVS